MDRSLSLALFTLCCAALATPPAAAQCHEHKIDGPFGASARFGSCVDAGVDRYVVGAPTADKVQIYVNTAGVWALDATLTGTPGTRFGDAVAIDGNTVAIGAPQDDPSGAADAGSVAVYTRTAPGTWTLATTLTAPTPTAGSHFGAAVDVDGAWVFVGEPQFGGDAGRVIVFRDQGAGFVQQQIILCTNGGDANTEFGAAVTLDGSIAVIGGPGANRNGFIDNGGGYCYRLFGGAWVGLTVASYAIDNARTGTSVVVDGDYILVNSEFEEAVANLKWNGSTFVVTGQFYEYLFPTFAREVELKGDLAIVTQPVWPGWGNTTDLTNVGAVILYRRDANDQYQPVNDETRVHPVNGQFGLNEDYSASIALAGNTLVVGAPGADTAGAEAGAVYTSDTSVDAWKWSAKSGTNPSTGLTQMYGYGSVCAGDPLELRLGTPFPSTPLVLIVGFSEVNLTVLGNTLIASPDIVLAGLSTDANGRFWLPATLPPSTPSGVKFYAQFFFATALSPTGWDSSPAFIGTVP